MGALVLTLLVSAGTLMMMNQGEVERPGIAQPSLSERNGARQIQPDIAQPLTSQRNGALRVEEAQRPDTPVERRVRITHTRTDTARNTGTEQIRVRIKQRRTATDANTESEHILVPDGESRTITIRETRKTDSNSAWGGVPPPSSDDGTSLPTFTSKKNNVLPSRLTFLTTGNPRPLPRPELDISGTRYIELSPKELKKLGIQQTDGKLVVFGEERRQIRDHQMAVGLAERGYDTMQREMVVRFQAPIDTMLAGIDAIENTTPNSYSAVAPIVIQCHYFFQVGGQKRAMVYFNRSPILTSSGGNLSDDDMEFLSGFDQKGDAPDVTASPSINRLVAVRVVDDGTLARGTDGRTAEIILWYLPTREFIDLLPDRYRESLRKEVEAITAVQREKLPPGAVCERLTGEQTYLDICRTGVGAVLFNSIAPNPAHDKITVNFRLMQERAVSLSLHDLSGGFMSQLAESTPLAIGEHSLSVNLGKVVAGTYLVAIRTAEGEQAVQRLIVR